MRMKTSVLQETKDLFESRDSHLIEPFRLPRVGGIMVPFDRGDQFTYDP